MVKKEYCYRDTRGEGEIQRRSRARGAPTSTTCGTGRVLS